MGPSGGTTKVPSETITKSLKLPEPEFKGAKVETAIHPGFRGVHLTAGFFGSGKSTIHFLTDYPENMLVVDLEAKGRNIAEQLGIQNYFAPVEEAAEVFGMDYKPSHIYQRVTQILSAVPPGRFTAVVLDGVTILQEGLLAEVKASPASYGISADKAASGSMGGAWPGVSIIFQKYFSLLKSRGVQVIGLTTELKSKWSKEGPILNQFEVKGVAVLNKYSIFTGITLPGDAENLGGPAGLVSKEQLGRTAWVDGKPIVQKKLPPKLPLYSMAEIYRYLDHPADWKALNAREIPSEAESKPYSPFVGKDQMGLLKAYLDAVRTGALKLEGDTVEDE